MKVELTNGEIDSFADDIYKVLRNVPLYYVNEIIELGLEGRQKDGEIDELDVSDSESDEEESDCESTEKDYETDDYNTDTED
tara:strand:+ start:883 stop:1128 length:246 start_codon:yes stop_codon:yes gene_type:complete